MGIEIIDLKTDKKKEKIIKIIEWDDKTATKNEHEHFMIKEILEQPEIIKKASLQDNEKLMKMAIGILRSKQVIITACGSSRYAALIGRYLFSKIGEKFCDVVMSSEFGYFGESIDKNTLIIAVSQSGETADVLEGLKQAKENGAEIYSIVNVADSTIARMSDEVLYLNCGPEIGIAATKSFLAQIIIFYVLAFAMDNKIEYANKKLMKISDLIKNDIADTIKTTKKIAKATKEQRDFFYIGRGINFAVASEGALKLKELSYIHAEGMPAGELKHGTIALIEDKSPVVAINPNDYTYLETLSNAEETKSRGAQIIGISDKESNVYDHHIKIAKVDEIFYPIMCIIPEQLLAYYLALECGKNPDRPRNLAKSVTVK
ncbi:MAG: isomerizing glutamine--fructose-6-phosphate transaminase [Candidatus Aenigmarchaeota archaeon]|nr:isomerizing glutamine--fructose-6-phosphate transaminase [Candidatus Aenigmarchaeota archaeon]